MWILYQDYQQEGLVFNTLFSEISYIGIKHKLKKELIYDLHIYRKDNENKKRELSDYVRFELGQYLLKELIELSYEGKIPKGLDLIKRPEFDIKKREVIKKNLYARYSIVGKRNSEEFILTDPDNPGNEVYMRTDNLESSKNTVDYLDEKVEAGELPVNISLVYIDVDSDGILSPQILVLNPDYLIDVTTVAECFKPMGGHFKYYFLNKFSTTSFSKYITIGNAVNNFFDILIENPETEFDSLIKDLFYFDPLVFCIKSDAELIETIKTLRQHFNNIKRVIVEDFKNIYLEVDNCILEPSFYSPIFGLQGRLDVFHRPGNSTNAAIVELKSGKLFMPNTYGLNTNHYTQTLLYELLIRSSFDFKVKPLNFILYSAIDVNAVRFAPTISFQQKEAISVRNDIVILEEKLSRGNQEHFVINSISTDRFPSASGFILKDLQEYENVFSKLDDIDKDYFEIFASFISREQFLSKTGYNYGGQSSGQSTLWLLDDEAKIENFSIFRNMNLLSFSDDKEKIAVFEKSEDTNELVNFRVGDIVLFYPTDSKRDFFIESQIYKSTIISISDDKLILKLRTGINRNNDDIFNVKWNIEHDFLDSGFNKLYKSLMTFCTKEPYFRKLILTEQAPKTPENVIEPISYPGLTISQAEIVNRILASNDYFLLWGPPGTGKTSKIIRESVNQMVNNGENILLLAYTNRAVDELCEALEIISDDFKTNYIRVGSRYSSKSSYHENLFDNIVRKFATRSALLKKIESTPVIVATVSSMMGKEELFYLKKFDTIIVDEASQLLEPMLVNLLSYGARFVLVGDHMQLPAVVTQKASSNKIKNSRLNDIGLNYTSDSLFDRMFYRAQEQNWDWAYGMLNEQGRMHEDIMKFSNEVYYDNKLRVIQGIPRLIRDRKLLTENALQTKLASCRLIFIESEPENNELVKINMSEAQNVKEVIRQWIEIYKQNNMELTPESIGVITTFRAQIAAIKNALSDMDIDFELITVDTVERYQGSARDIIIFSMSVNSITRFNQIINPDKNGLDRKLNVVITRTKEHFIWLGNRNIIAENENYSKLLNMSDVMEVGD
ncbi:MAG: ATP-dependent helicase [Saprospiraceae bacterium]